MKRRRFVQSIAAVPVLPAAAQQLAVTGAEAVAEGGRRFFSAEQYKALQALCDIVMPKNGTVPGAVEAEVPAFLDFLISESDRERQALYRNGLDKLKGLPANADTLLAPLTQSWTYKGPADPFARFLREAKDDILRATLNSRPYAQAMSARSRSAAGMDAYWLPLD